MFLDKEIPQEILNMGKKRTFMKGDHIYSLNSNLINCYLILSGSVKVYIDHSNGRRSILGFVGSNDWLGELSLFCHENEIKENKVLHEVECLEFSLNELRELCKSNAKVSFYFASYISNKLLERSYRMSESLNYSLNRRLAAFIIQYQHNGIYNIPHTDVSEYMNVSYRHVLYVIQQFCEIGILRKGTGKEYIISDIELLREMHTL